ncbi:MAG: alpha/beta hydrolase [Desulfobulbaceae bacterium]|nr:alpha/beta hydrolase [Desulfobulbaceae bacterium]
MKANKNALIALVVISLITSIAGCGSVHSLKKENVSTVNSMDGSSITYGVRGQGNITIVFVHCWTCNHEFWRPQIEYFSNKYKVVWLDLAGHGLSNSNRQEYTMPAFGEDVAAVVNRIDGDNVILVGHSMGGPVAIEAAKLLGDKVIGIVGVDTFYTPFEYPKSEAEIDGFVKPFKDDFKGTSEQLLRSMFTPEADPDLITSIVKQISVANQDMGVSAMYEIFRWNTKNVPSALNKYSKKLRNINGAPTGEEIALHKSVYLIPGAGHFVAQVKPNEFNQVLNRIITEYQAH